MSGGVDSALTAALLKDQGFEVIGVTLQLYSYAQSLEETPEDKKHCHPLAFIESARQAAKALGIPHHVVNKEDLFQNKIVDPFIQAYKEGQTPLPCVRCNRDVKTHVLHNLMKEWDAQGIATGHYVRSIQTPLGVQMHQGLDPRRDQSFFLFALTQEQLNVMHFPLGGKTKEETRTQAEQFGLDAAFIPASQDLCFIAKKSYKTLFAPEPGPIIHIDGRILGEHQHIAHYTRGQRQGLAIGGLKEPLYVVRVDHHTNTVIVGPREALAKTEFFLSEVNWLAHDIQTVECPSQTHEVWVKLRSASAPVRAWIEVEKGAQSARVTLENPDMTLSPGQVCVFYQGTRLLGGGWIKE